MSIALRRHGAITASRDGEEFLLPVEHGDYEGLLRELIKIDMEYRWKRLESGQEKREVPQASNASHCLLVEDYASQCPIVRSDGLTPRDLISEE